MDGHAVMKLENDGSRSFVVAYPTKAQALQSASYCSYPVQVVPVYLEQTREKRQPRPHSYHSRMKDGPCSDCGLSKSDHP